jgi:phytoene dehydrogenase-like protein
MIPAMQHFDAIVVGGGHNGLVAATMLGRAGWSVCVLERRERPGGAAVSESPWPGVPARISRYAYLVSLFPSDLRRELGLELTLRPRMTAERPSPELRAWRERLAWLAERLAPTLLQPLRAREEIRRLVGDEQLWRDVFERPLGQALERELSEDGERGVVLTDGLIGTFASAHEPDLRQNRCFLYHVIGDGHGRWEVPVGGMGALTDELRRLATAAGAQIRTGVGVTAVRSDGVDQVEVALVGAEPLRARHALLGCAIGPALDGLAQPPEGAQLKLNLLLRRLPRLRDPSLEPEEAFRGTFHVHEGYRELQAAHAQAAAGRIPTPAPCECYCHSLSDASILGEELRAAGAHTLTVFGLHMPARLFADPARHDAAKRAAVRSTLASLNDVLAEPIEDCLWLDADGRPCLEARTPIELQSELGLPAGHIFHRDLRWPFAERAEEVGRWGVETALRNVWICGAAARRGGGVSGIPGHNAARAALAAG